ncbi:unnamed protein product [Ilex paraguariensis]|uniref:Uncharacterized protein n=1 Tax=Ilex paraguariensis TaxID=185542 RepID=A0ABC8RE92_9AQUA
MYFLNLDPQNTYQLVWYCSCSWLVLGIWPLRIEKQGHGEDECKKRKVPYLQAAEDAQNTEMQGFPLDIGRKDKAREYNKERRQGNQRYLSSVNQSHLVQKTQQIRKPQKESITENNADPLEDSIPNFDRHTAKGTPMINYE